MSNAVKFTHQGEIIVRVEKISPNDTGTSMLRLSVSDTGIGIKPDNLQKVFQAFSQEDTSTTRRYGGTGLGLSISRQLVERMGGMLSVESTFQKGSTFHSLFEGAACTRHFRPQGAIPGRKKPCIVRFPTQ